MQVLFRLVGLFLLLSIPLSAQDNEKCLECHGKTGLSIERAGRVISLYVDPEGFAASLHGEEDCISCHTDLDGVEEWPHAATLERVNCMECHEEDEPSLVVYWNSRHGQLVKAGDVNAPLCQDCHGSHDILPQSNPASRIAPLNVVRACAHCHAEGTEAQRTHDIPEKDVFQRYSQSIHGQGLLRAGLTVTAVCTSCHTGHNVLPHTDPNSTIHKDNVVATCTQCHGNIPQVHEQAIDGELWKREGAVPVCVECHPPHAVREVYYNSGVANRDCLGCHGLDTITASDDGRSLHVDAAEQADSVHARNNTTCAQCHVGVTPTSDPATRSCRTITEKVQCQGCHEAQVARYKAGIHGKLTLAGDTGAPNCTDCHGRHDILEHAMPENANQHLAELVRRSPTFSRNVPTLCGRCHQEGAQAAIRYFGSEEKILEHYRMSIHGKGLLESGLTVTATCTACHTAHMELPADDENSSVNRRNIAGTCGQCHDGIFEQFENSIHSELGNPEYEGRRVRGMPGLPHCNDCHSAHTVARTDGYIFKLGIMEQCGKSLEDVTESYFETYHGKASTLGDATRAKCYDCHGAHDILPVANPASHLSEQNIVGTCGKCHEGSHRQFTSYLNHGTHDDRDKYPVLFWTFWGMTTLLLGTFGFFGLHTLAWLPRSWKLRREYRRAHGETDPNEKRYVRFTRLQRQLHGTMIVSFFGLALTGMMLKFSATKWALFLFTILGGIDGAGLIHRICAVVTFGYFFSHIVNAFSRFRKSGRTYLQYFWGEDSMMIWKRDVQEFWGTLKWFFGRGPRPSYGRWTYWEKFDYLAVFWGVAVIGSTGLCLWFPELFTKFLPGQAINVATIIHSDEALLATGFIFTIHFFNTHFRPDKFPMDTVIFTGRMTLSELKEDKPRLYEQLVASGELEKHLREPATPRFIAWVKFFGFVALGVGFTLVALIIYSTLAS